MLTRPEVHEAEANAHYHEAKANSHEAKAKIALIFKAKFYILTPISRKSEIFDETSKISAQNGL